MSVEYRADAFAADVPPERCISIVRFRPTFGDIFLTTLGVVVSVAIIGVPAAVIFFFFR
jgi:hypothetical protein